MKVSSIYFKIVKKNLPLVAINLVVFLALVIILNIASNPASEVFTTTKTNISITNNDNSPLSKNMIDYLENYSNIVYLEGDELRDALFYSDVSGAITIPESFENDLLSGNTPEVIVESVPNSYGVFIVENAIDKYINTAKIYLEHNLSTSDDLIEKITNDLDAANDYVDISIPSVSISNSKVLQYYNSLAYALCSLLITIVGVIMASFGSTNIKRRLDICPIDNKRINFSLIGSNYLLGACTVVFFIVLSIAMYQGQIFTLASSLMIINAFVLMISVISISYLLSSLTTSMNLISALGTIISLGASMLTGVFIPQSLLNENLLTIGKLIPTYWYIRANDGISALTEAAAYDLSDYFLCLAAQIIISIILVVITFFIKKRKLVANL